MVAVGLSWNLNICTFNVNLLFLFPITFKHVLYFTTAHAQTHKFIGAMHGSIYSTSCGLLFDACGVIQRKNEIGEKKTVSPLKTL